MARTIERKLLAEVFPCGNGYSVSLAAKTGDSLGIFDIPSSKDVAEWMQRHGWTYIGRSDDMRSEMWGKYIFLS